MDWLMTLYSQMISTTYRMTKKEKSKLLQSISAANLEAYNNNYEECMKWLRWAALLIKKHTENDNQ